MLRTRLTVHDEWHIAEYRLYRRTFFMTVRKLHMYTGKGRWSWSIRMRTNPNRVLYAGDCDGKGKRHAMRLAMASAQLIRDDDLGIPRSGERSNVR